MYAFLLVSFSLVEILAWYISLFKLYLFPREHSFIILNLRNCFELSLLFQYNLYINFLLCLSFILENNDNCVLQYFYWLFRKGDHHF